jgi:hypothetical protein
MPEKDALLNLIEKVVVDTTVKESSANEPINGSSGIIIKEMFIHTKLKIYPDGSIFMEIKGRPSKFTPTKPFKQPAKVVEKVKMKTIEEY